MLLSFKRKITIDENELAQDVVAVEGKRRAVDIGQAKELQKILLDTLAIHWLANPRGVVELLKKHRP